MYNFAQTALKLLNDYKNLIKKSMPSSEMSKKLLETNLNHRLPKEDHGLYCLLAKIIENGEIRGNGASPRQAYSGIDHFLGYMKNVFSQYQIENDKVIHATQAASAAMIEAIQLMRLPNERLTEKVNDRLQYCIRLIAKYGLEEQKQTFLDSLNTQLPRQADFFTPLVNDYQSYLTEQLGSQPNP